MTEQELKEYAATLILEHARDVERQSIFEMAEQYAPGDTISSGEVTAVGKLIRSATIEVSFPGEQS